MKTKEIEQILKHLHGDLKEGGMYDGKVPEDFKAGWQDALQWVMTSLHPNKAVNKDLTVE